MRAASPDLPMPPLFRRLLLLFHALRFGARLFWLAAPREHKLHWIITLVKRVHATEGGRNSLHSMLPALGPLATTFIQSLATRPELATGTLHDAFDAIGRLETPLPPEQVEAALAERGRIDEAIPHFERMLASGPSAGSMLCRLLRPPSVACTRFTSVIIQCSLCSRGAASQIRRAPKRSAW